MLKSEEIYNKLVDTATEAAWNEYIKEITPPLHLLYKKSTRTEAGQILPVRQGHPCPEGFLSAPGGTIPPETEKEKIHAWIDKQCRELLIRLLPRQILSNQKFFS